MKKWQYNQNIFKMTIIWLLSLGNIYMFDDDKLLLMIKVLEKNGELIYKHVFVTVRSLITIKYFILTLPSTLNWFQLTLFSMIFILLLVLSFFVHISLTCITVSSPNSTYTLHTLSDNKRFETKRQVICP